MPCMHAKILRGCGLLTTSIAPVVAADIVVVAVLVVAFSFFCSHASGAAAAVVHRALEADSAVSHYAVGYRL